jgi:membrane protease YdiL (CAAX protease family)
MPGKNQELKMSSKNKYLLIWLITGNFLIILGFVAWYIKNYIDTHTNNVFVPEKCCSYHVGFPVLSCIDYWLWFFFAFGICAITVIAGEFVFRKLKNKIQNYLTRHKQANEIRQIENISMKNF